jgi:superfamily II DNA helicase RecQ
MFERAVEKLVAFGGAAQEPGGITRGAPGFLKPYAAQRQHRRIQLERVRLFADRRQCRMTQIAEHFGDRVDGGRPCGLCDGCNPLLRAAGKTASDPATEKAVLRHLREQDGATVGQLARALSRKSRSDVEHAVFALERAGTVRRTEDSFEADDGRTVTFFRVYLQPREGRARKRA